MSVRVSAWVWEHARVAGNDLLILLALADNADDTGMCWPSVAYLATKTRLHVDTVRRRLRHLAETGAVVATVRDGRSSLYRIPLTPPQIAGGSTDPTPPQTAVDHPPANCTPPQTAPPRSVRETPPRSVQGDPPAQLTEGNRKEPSKNHKKATQAPDNFRPTDAMTEWARGVLGYSVDLHDLTEHFLDHHRAKGNTFRDWDSAWRTWVRNARKFNQTNHNAEPSRPGFWQEASA